MHTITGIIGPNGAGKTEYLRSLARDKDAAFARAASDMHFFGNNPHQHFRALTFGWRELDIDAAEAFVDFDPATPWRKLSVGQRQLVIAAGALASHLPVLLFDEPFNGLDAEHRELLRQRIATAAESASVMVTSQHSQDLAGLVDVVVPIRNFERFGPFDMEQLCLAHPVLSGSAEDIARLVTTTPLRDKQLGRRRTVTVAKELSPSEVRAARELGVQVSYLSPAELIDLVSASTYPHAQSGTTNPGSFNAGPANPVTSTERSEK